MLEFVQYFVVIAGIIGSTVYLLLDLYDYIVT
jgi:hypothetical protein